VAHRCRLQMGLGGCRTLSSRSSEHHCEIFFQTDTSAGTCFIEGRQVTRLSQRDLAAGWGLEATYTVRLRLIGRPIVDFLLVIIDPFCWVLRLICYERLSDFKIM